MPPQWRSTSSRANWQAHLRHAQADAVVATDALRAIRTAHLSQALAGLAFQDGALQANQQRATGAWQWVVGDGHRATGAGQQVTSAGQRATTDDRRATGAGQNAASAGRRATGAGYRATSASQRATVAGQRATRHAPRLNSRWGNYPCTYLTGVIISIIIISALDAFTPVRGSRAFPTLRAIAASILA